MSNESKLHRVNLDWLPAAVLEESERELEALCQLRMMLAGLAFRHGVDRKTGTMNEGLGADVAAAQSALQVSIDRARANVDAMRDLATALKGERSGSAMAPAKEILH